LAPWALERIRVINPRPRAKEKDKQEKLIAEQRERDGKKLCRKGKTLMAQLVVLGLELKKKKKNKKIKKGNEKETGGGRLGRYNHTRGCFERCCSNTKTPCVLLFSLLYVAVCSTSLVCAVRSVSKTLAREQSKAGQRE